MCVVFIFLCKRLWRSVIVGDAHSRRDGRQHKTTQLVPDVILVSHAADILLGGALYPL